MSESSESECLPPGERNNKPVSVPGHYINTSAAENNETLNSESKESISLLHKFDKSDVGDRQSYGDVHGAVDNGHLLDDTITTDIDNGFESKFGLSFLDPARYRRAVPMDEGKKVNKPRPPRKYLQRKRLRLLVNKVMEKFRENVKNQRPIRLHMNLKPKQAWDYGPLTTGAYNETGNVSYTIPLTQWTIEGQLSVDDSLDSAEKKSVLSSARTIDVSSSEKNQDERSASPSIDAVNVETGAYIVDSDEEEDIGYKRDVNSKSRTASAAAVTTGLTSSEPGREYAPESVALTTEAVTVPTVSRSASNSASFLDTAPVMASTSENVTSTSAAENVPLHLVTIPTDKTDVGCPSPTKSAVKSSQAVPTVSEKPVLRSAPVINPNKAITFVSSTYDKPKQNVTFARSTTSIPLSTIKPIHSAPTSGNIPSSNSTLHREDTWGSRAPLPSLASHDSIRFDEEDGSETSSSSPNKRKIIVTLPDISTDVEETKKVPVTKEIENATGSGFPSAKSSKSLPRQSRKSPQNHAVECSGRSLVRNQSDVPSLKVVGSNNNNELHSTNLHRVIPGNTKKESVEVVASEVCSVNGSEGSPEVPEAVPHVTPMVASIPKLHTDNTLLSIKGTNVSNSQNTMGDCVAETTWSESLDFPKNVLGNRLSIVIVNGKRAKACRQRHKRRSAHENELEQKLYRERSFNNRQSKSMEYTGPFIERSKTVEFPSLTPGLTLTPGKVWNPDVDTTGTIKAINPEHHKGKTCTVCTVWESVYGLHMYSLVAGSNSEHILAFSPVHRMAGSPLIIFAYVGVRPFSFRLWHV